MAEDHGCQAPSVDKRFICPPWEDRAVLLKNELFDAVQVTQ
jgi:hypothetical protein